MMKKGVARPIQHGARYASKKCLLKESFSVISEDENEDLFDRISHLDNDLGYEGEADQIILFLHFFTGTFGNSFEPPPRCFPLATFQFALNIFLINACGNGFDGVQDDDLGVGDLRHIDRVIKAYSEFLLRSVAYRIFLICGIISVLHSFLKISPFHGLTHPRAATILICTPVMVPTQL